MNKLKIDNIYKNIAGVGLVVLCIKIIALFKERYIGRIFGISETLDIFYILILVPFFIDLTLDS